MPTKSGTVGSRMSKTDDKGNTTEDRRSNPLVASKPEDEMTASVGLSISIGMNTEFSREKIDISAWCTLPSRPDEDSRKEAYESCYESVTEEIHSRFDETVKKFFPHLGE